MHNRDMTSKTIAMRFVFSGGNNSTTARSCWLIQRPMTFHVKAADNKVS